MLPIRSSLVGASLIAAGVLAGPAHAAAADCVTLNDQAAAWFDQGALCRDLQKQLSEGRFDLGEAARHSVRGVPAPVPQKALAPVRPAARPTSATPKKTARPKRPRKGSDGPARPVLESRGPAPDEPEPPVLQRKGPGPVRPKGSGTGSARAKAGAVHHMGPVGRPAAESAPPVPMEAVRLPDGRLAWVMTPTPGEVSAEPRPEGEMPWRSPVYGALVLLLFALLGAHRFVTRSTPALVAGGRSSAAGQRSAVSHVEGTVGVTGPGGDGFLRAVLVELVTRGSGRVVIGEAELSRLFGGRLERGVLAALSPRLHVCDLLEDAIEYLELELLLDGDGLHWFVAPGADADVVRPLLATERLHALVLGPWERTREIDGRGILDGQLVPTLTSAEAAERLHLYTLTL